MSQHLSQSTQFGKSFDFINLGRAIFPLIPKQISHYRIVNNRIESEACEISVVDHCNLTCRACSHLSPVIQRHSQSPAEIEHDLSLLSNFYHVEHVRLLGGEPLLHPNILEIIKAVRRSEITRRIRIITNGSFPHRMTSEFWEDADEVHISIYPSNTITSALLEGLKKKAREFGTQLIIKRFDFFRESYSEQGTNDQDLVARIYRSCQVAHIWRCHNVSHGYFYRCPQSIFIPEVVGESHKSDFDGDRLRIHNGDSFGEELLDFLERSTPLSACSYCLGSVGRSFPHAQVVRSSWRKFQKYRTEDLVDWAFLKTLEDKADTKNGCFLEIN